MLLWFLLLARNFSSHFFFVSLNSNRWQGNTYGAVNYLLGVNLSCPHSDSVFIWFIQTEKRNMQFGVWYWLVASNTQWKAFSRNGVIVLSVLSQYLCFVQWITKHLQNWQFHFENEKMERNPFVLRCNVQLNTCFWRSQWPIRCDIHKHIIVISRKKNAVKIDRCIST